MNALIVTSAEPGDGKSTVAAALALHLLTGGRRVHLLRVQGADAASAERDAALLAAVPGVRSPGQALTLSKAGAAVKKAAAGGVAIIEAEPAEAREAAAGWGAGVLLVQRGAAVQESGVLGDAAGKAAVALTAVPARDLAKAIGAPGAGGLRPLLVLPEDRILAAPRLGELVGPLEASFLCSEDGEEGVVERVMIGSVGHDPGPPYFSMHETKAVITRFEKTDVQLAALGTPLVCLVLTGGQQPSPYLFDRAQSTGVPVLLTARDTAGAMQAVGEAYAGARFGGERKLERLRELLAGHVDTAVLESLLD